MAIGMTEILGHCDYTSRERVSALCLWVERPCSLSPGPVLMSKSCSIGMQLYERLNCSIDWLAVFAMEDVTRGELLRARCW